MGRKKIRTEEYYKEYKKLKAREYYIKNPERIKINSKRFREKNPEVILLSAKKQKERVYSNPELFTIKRLKNVLSLMKRRCYNPLDKRYIHYGARGILICNEWLFDTDSFIEWSLNNGYQFGLSIERVNNDDIYSPYNCKWATCKDQQNNKRSSVFVEYDGKRLTLSQWSDITGVSTATLSNRNSKGILPPLLFQKAFKGCNKLTYFTPPTTL